MNNSEDGFSPKLFALVKNVNTLPGKHFVFTTSTPSYGGTTAICASLLCIGLKQLNFVRRGKHYTCNTEIKPEFKYFAMLPNETNMDLQFAILSFFNDASNSNGDKCCCLVANKSYNQGISVFDTNWFHMTDEISDMFEVEYLQYQQRLF